MTSGIGPIAPTMTQPERELSLIYIGAFADPHNWSQADHLNGLKAVFAAGASARAKADRTSSDSGEA